MVCLFVGLGWRQGGRDRDKKAGVPRENRDCWKTDSGERSTTDVLTVALQQQEAT